MFVLNPDEETLDDTLYILQLGDASPEVYLIATNTTDDLATPRIGLEAPARRVQAADAGQPSRARPASGSALDHLSRLRLRRSSRRDSGNGAGGLGLSAGEDPER